MAEKLDVRTISEILKDIETGLDDLTDEIATTRDLELLASQQDLWALENRIMGALDRMEKRLNGPKTV